MDLAREKLQQARKFDSGNVDPEAAKQAMDNIQEAKRLLDLTRKDHARDIRQIDLDKVIATFDKVAREHARPSEESSFDSLARTAQRAIDESRGDFATLLDELRGRLIGILWRQDGFIIARFKWLSDDSHLFPDQRAHAQLVSEGQAALRSSDIDKLREVVMRLDAIRIGSSGEDEIMAAANIVRN